MIVLTDMILYTQEHFLKYQATRTSATKTTISRYSKLGLVMLPMSMPSRATQKASRVSYNPLT